jgi:hypothetical protein
MSEPQSGDGERRPGTKTANPHAKAHNRSGAHGDSYAHTPGSITTGPGLRRTLPVPAGQCGGHPDACLQAGRSFQRRLLFAVFTLDGLKLCRQCRHVGSGLRHVVTARRRPRVFLGSGVHGVHGVSLCEF